MLENQMVSVSLDVDWAPDYILEDVIGLLSKYNIPSTWFVTHSSSIWNELRKSPKDFELGIHPNFLPNSSQGKSITEIVDYLMGIIPEAKIFRTHGFFQYGTLLADLQKLTNINIDSSIFLPEIDHIQPINHLTPNGILKRVPVYWADDYELLKPKISSSFITNIQNPGLKVFNFHPIHIYLNSPSFAFYETVKQQNYSQNLSSYSGFGIRNIFIELLEFLNRKRSIISSLGKIRS
ncbi:MAG: hypothetical protein KF798_00485 [Candidatus Paracaedibacteraceae bacterium]|nr:hypothetical protein [Candidatus Paracaedibacteraceae bacterium]